MLEWMDEGVVCEFEPIAGGDRRDRPRGSAEGNGSKRDKAGPPASYTRIWYPRSPSSIEFLPLETAGRRFSLLIRV